MLPKPHASPPSTARPVAAPAPSRPVATPAADTPDVAATGVPRELRELRDGMLEHLRNLQRP